MHVFLNVLFIAVINAWVAFKEAIYSNMRIRIYILKIAEELRDKYVAKHPEVMCP